MAAAFLALATPAVAQSSLSVTLRDAADPVASGDQVFYTATVHNAGPDAEPAATLVVQFPSGYTFITSTPTTPTCTPSGQTVTCTGPLAADASTSVELVVRVGDAGSSQVGTYTVRATVSGTNADPDSTNNTDLETTTLGYDGSGGGLSVSALDTVTSEGNSSLMFTVALSQPSISPVTVQYATFAAPGGVGYSAAAGVDYTPVSGTLSFPPGTTARAVVVPILADVVDERNEALMLVLSNPAGAPIYDGRVQGTILDDDGRPAPCVPIVELPYIIRQQGSYCLVRNQDVGNTLDALTIASDFVLLDLNGFKIDGGQSFKELSRANGIYAFNRRNITVRNGKVSGFLRGIFLAAEADAPGSSQGHVVEGILADGNAYAGIHVQGADVVLRRNRVVNTGSTLVALPGAEVFAMRADGPGSRLLGNQVADTFSTFGTGGTGLKVAMALMEGSAAVVEENRVYCGGQTNSVAVFLLGGRDVLAAGNRLATCDIGLVYDAATGKYRGNMTSGVSAPYNGGTDAGNNQ